MDDLVSLAAPMQDSAAETARVSFCSSYARVQLEVALEELCFFVASERGKDWLPILCERLVLTD